MRLIYDGKDGAEIRVGQIRFRVGAVTGEIREALAAHLVAQKHLGIRAATAKEIAAADGIAVVVEAVAKGESVVDAIESAADERKAWKKGKAAKAAKAEAVTDSEEIGNE